MSSVSKIIEGGELTHAINSSGSGLDRGGCSSLAHQPVHPHGGFHKDDFECRRGHCRGFVAPERFWYSRSTLHHPCREVSDHLFRDEDLRTCVPNIKVSCLSFTIQSHD